jgi:folate-dependent phosphoribosylglycinamide formyltransferase PurN
VHPALLPAFGGKGMYGQRVHRAVIASGARVSGATAHFVDEVYDRGAIIAQWPVPVFADDTPASLAERVLRVEHLVLPRAVEAVATRRVALGADGAVHGALRGSFAGAAFTLAARDDAALASDIATALFEQ